MSLLLLFFTAGEAPPVEPETEIYGTSTFLPVSSGLVSLTPETQGAISVTPETQGEIRVHPLQAMPTINLNSRATVAMSFRSVEDGTPVDPAVVRVKISNPDQEITTITHPDADITNDEVGEYSTSILFDIPGKWLVRWEGESSNETSEETTVHVNGSAFYDADGDELPDS